MLVNVVELSKAFGGPRRGKSQQVLSNVNLAVPEGQFTCVLGPSGCGKTTLLNIIAGFEAPTAGQVFIDGRPVRGPGSDRVVVFQDSTASLFPWLTAEENVAFGPKLHGVPTAAAAEICRKYLSLVGLWEDRSKFPRQLSGGMRQRVQIARALAMQPMVLLMDEPFAALDALTRRRMHEELLKIWEQTRTTVLFITHDVAEAITLADRIVLLTPGPGSTVAADLTVDLLRPREPAGEPFQKYMAQMDRLLRVTPAEEA